MTDICEKMPKSRFIGFINSAYGDLDKFDVASCYARVKRNSGVLHVFLLNSRIHLLSNHISHKNFPVFKGIKLLYSPSLLVNIVNRLFQEYLNRGVTFPPGLVLHVYIYCTHSS